MARQAAGGVDTHTLVYLVQGDWVYFDEEIYRFLIVVYV